VTVLEQTSESLLHMELRDMAEELLPPPFPQATNGRIVL
jgi:hypothetical protein